MLLHNLNETISNAIFLGLVAGIPLYGMLRKVNVYDCFVDGAKDGFTIVIKIIPYLVAILVAIGMFRASGAMQLIASQIQPLLHWLGIPTEVLTLAIMRPFSGSGSNAILADIIHHYGPNSFAAKTAATMMGSTETTFYVLAVYFGSVAIKRTRQAIPAGLIADFTGVVAAIVVCHFFF